MHKTHPQTKIPFLFGIWHKEKKTTTNTTRAILFMFMNFKRQKNQMQFEKISSFRAIAWFISLMCFR